MFDLRTAKELKPKQQLMGGWMLRILKMSVYKKKNKKIKIGGNKLTDWHQVNVTLKVLNDHQLQISLSNHKKSSIL